VGDRTGGVTFVDTSRLSKLGVITDPSRQSEGMVSALAFSPDGRYLAVGLPQGQILVWSTEKSSPPRFKFRIPSQRGSVSHLVFDSQSQRLASCSASTEPIVEIWNLELLNDQLSSLGLGD
jgi:WD40 repeat protein